jgi:hypothetical protein
MIANDRLPECGRSGNVQKFARRCGFDFAAESKNQRNQTMVCRGPVNVLSILYLSPFTGDAETQETHEPETQVREILSILRSRAVEIAKFG